jgi:hypothetical protein
MFMNDDKNKKIAALIISKKKSPDSDAEVKPAPMGENGAPNDYEMGMKTAAEEMISAVESKDSKKLVEAAKSLIAMIRDEQDDEDDS